MRNKEVEQKESGQTRLDEESVSRARKIGRFINRGSRHPLVLITYGIGGLLFTANYATNHANETVVVPLKTQLETTGSQVQSFGPKVDGLTSAVRDGSTTVGTGIDKANKGLDALHNDINPNVSEPTTVPTPPAALPEHGDGRNETANGAIPSTTTTTAPVTTTTSPQ